MANAVVAIEIPEAEVARTRAMLRRFTGLPSTASAKQLVGAAINRIVVSQEAQVEAEAAAAKTFAEPGIT